MQWADYLVFELGQYRLRRHTVGLIKINRHWANANTGVFVGILNVFIGERLAEELLIPATRVRFAIVLTKSLLISKFEKAYSLRIFLL